MPVSGNHGRSSADTPPSGTGNLVPSTTPQQSTLKFVAPSSAPIKKTPDITDIIGEGVKEGRSEGVRERGSEGVKENGIDSASQITNLIPQTDNLTPQTDNFISQADNFISQTDNLTSSPPHSLTPSLPHSLTSSLLHSFTPSLSADFSTHWQTMFHQIFASVPTIYIPLKETLPQIENKKIKVSVKNEIQKEHFEAKTREVLAYLRTHFDEQIEDIIVETNEQFETKKIIYDVKDKLQNFKEQNIEFDDFVQILDLKIKD